MFYVLERHFFKYASVCILNCKKSSLFGLFIRKSLLCCVINTHTYISGQKFYKHGYEGDDGWWVFSDFSALFSVWGRKIAQHASWHDKLLEVVIRRINLQHVPLRYMTWSPLLLILTSVCSMKTQTLVESSADIPELRQKAVSESNRVREWCQLSLNFRHRCTAPCPELYTELACVRSSSFFLMMLIIALKLGTVWIRIAGRQLTI